MNEEFAAATLGQVLRTTGTLADLGAAVQRHRGCLGVEIHLMITSLLREIDGHLATLTAEVEEEAADAQRTPLEEWLDDASGPLVPMPSAN